MMRLGALCRWRLGTPLLMAPTEEVGWDNKAKRLRVAPHAAILARITVRLPRSRARDNAVGPAFSKNPTVDCGTVNKAFASFRVGELRLKDLTGDAIRLARSHSQGLRTDPEQDREAFFRSGGRHRRTSTDASLYAGGGQDGNPSPKAGSKTVFSGTREPR